MESPDEELDVARLDERRKDTIAGGLFLGLCLAALVYLRLRQIPINLPIYKVTILKDFTRDLFIFRPQ